MHRTTLIFITLLANISILFANNDLLLLDQVLDNQDTYIEKKEEQLRELKKKLALVTTDEEFYDINLEMYFAYQPYVLDSALYYMKRSVSKAYELGDRVRIKDATLSLGLLYTYMGMYKESLDIMHRVDLQPQDPDWLKRNYYHLHQIVYHYLEDYTVDEEWRDKYQKIKSVYRDSALVYWSVTPYDTYTTLLAEKMMDQKNFDGAIHELETFIVELPSDSRSMGFVAYTLSQVYHQLQDREKEKHYLILSAIADISGATKEYISLRRLAIMLYEEGDIDRAYRYITQCMQDATFSNARLRTLEISEVLPLIDQAYQSKKEKQAQVIRRSLLLISVLSVLLLLIIGYVYKQMLSLRVARQKQAEANKQLQLLNDELSTSYKQLQELNSDLSETSRIKEEYIARFMDQCSVYLDKMEEYRSSLSKLAKAGKVEELYKNIKSKTFIEKEVEDFYLSFDSTFLNLFPTFVEDFNALLAENDKVYPKPGEKLNTGLRIYALIRLGITDSNKISQFLRYPVTTIYNYRTRLRNKAAGNRDEFEKEVMKIGQIH